MTATVEIKERQTAVKKLGSMRGTVCLLEGVDGVDGVQGTNESVTDDLSLTNLQKCSILLR